MPEAKLFRMLKARFILYFTLLVALLAVCAAFLWPLGVYFQGFVYGPPNNRGYLVNAADQ